MAAVMPVALILAVLGSLVEVAPSYGASGGTQYLIMQSFWGANIGPQSGLSSDGSGMSAPSPWNQSQFRSALEDYVTKTQKLIGTSGLTPAPNRMYGFGIGPLTLEQTDPDLINSIQTAFDVAIERNVAVVIHFDVTHYWKFARLSNGTLLSAGRGEQDNRAWKDWNGVIADKDPWDGVPALLPSMCFECQQVKALVDYKAGSVIGPAIKNGLDRLHAANKDALFAGVVIGWEADSGNSSLDYHSLTLKGFSRSNPPADIPHAGQQVLHDYLLRWTKTIALNGIPKEKIYTHIAGSNGPDSLWSAFNDYANGGFSIYVDATGEQPFADIWAEAGKHSGSWGIGEGTNVSLNPSMTAAGALSVTGLRTPITWDTYLGKVFGHGGNLACIVAAFVNADGFSKATESSQAVTAYQTFLKGQTLQMSAPQALTQAMGICPNPLPSNAPAKVTGACSQIDQAQKANKVAFPVPGFAPIKNAQILKMIVTSKIMQGNYDDAATIMQAALNAPCPSPLPSGAPAGLANQCEALQTAERAGRITYPVPGFDPIKNDHILNSIVTTKINEGSYDDAATIMRVAMNAPCPSPLPSGAPAVLSGQCQQLQDAESAGRITYPIPGFSPIKNVQMLNGIVSAKITQGNYNDASTIIQAALKGAK